MLLSNLNHVGLLKDKSDTEQAYPLIYLVYVWQKIKHANTNIDMTRN